MALLGTERRLLLGPPAARAALWAMLFCSLGLAPHSDLLQAQRFSAPVTITTGNNPAALLAADFTATGTPELLALDAGASAVASSVRVLTNGSGAFSVGSFVATAGTALLAMPSRPGMLPDLYWAAASGANLTLMRASAQTGGTYTPGTALTTFPLSGSATPRFLLATGGLHAGYANAVIVADTANNQLYTVLPNPDGTYAIQPVYSYPGLPLIAGATQLLTADLNGDGLPDLLVAGAVGVQVFLAQGSGASSFSGFNTSTTYPCTGTVQSIALADMDGDAQPDLLVEGANGRIDIYHGNGDGTFAATSEVGTGADNAATGNGGHLVGVSDLDGDGNPDLVLANPQGITVLLGTGSRNFQLNATYAAGATPTHFVFTDLNGDGRPDIAFDSPEGVTILDAQGLATVTTITNLVTPIFYGQEIGYTNGIDAVVSVAPAGTGVPPAGATTEGGLIYVYLDGVLACSLTVGATNPTGGPERCNDANFQGYPAGTHTMVGAYQGNSYYAPSTSDTYTVVILPDDTTTTLATSLTPAPFGTPVTFTARVAAAYATPAGTVVFTDGAKQIGTAIVDASGTATFTTSALAIGTHTISASFAAPLNSLGLVNFSPSSTSTAQVIQAASTVALTSSPNPSTFGQVVTFTATVAVGGAPASMAGSTSFIDAGTVLASVPLDARGVATYTTASLAVGTHPITATFVPFSSNTFGSSASLTQVVTQAPAGANDFALTVTPADIAIGVGNTGIVTVAVRPGINFLEPVALTCSGLPWEATCAFVPSTVPSGGGSAQLTIHPEAPHNCSDTTQYFIAGTSGRLALALAALTALLFSLRRRPLFPALLALALCVLPMLSGCGLGGHCTDLGTRPGSYTFTVTGTSTGSAGISHSQTVHMQAYLYGEPH